MTDTPYNPALADDHAARRFSARAARQARFELAREVERRMAGRLPLVKLQPGLILDAGTGVGEGMRMLSRLYPQARCLGLDWSFAMLDAARQPAGFGERMQRLTRTGHLQWLCGDLARLPLATGSCDLVWSNLALCWVADPAAAFAEIARVLRPGGLLMYATYGPDTLKELRECFAAEDDCPHVLTFPDMHDLGDMMAGAGLVQPVMDMETFTLTYSAFDGLLGDLRHSGQANSTRGRRRTLTGSRRWQRVVARYERARLDGRLPATFEIVYGHAWAGSKDRLADKDRLPDGRSIIRTDFARLKRTG